MSAIPCLPPQPGCDSAGRLTHQQKERSSGGSFCCARYLPKGTDLNSYPRRELRLDRIAAELNDRPRLCLADRSPAQLMRQWHLPPSPAIRDDP